MSHAFAPCHWICSQTRVRFRSALLRPIVEWTFGKKTGFSIEKQEQEMSSVIDRMSPNIGNLCASCYFFFYASSGVIVCNRIFLFIYDITDFCSSPVHIMRIWHLTFNFSRFFAIPYPDFQRIFTNKHPNESCWINAHFDLKLVEIERKLAKQPKKSTRVAEWLRKRPTLEWKIKQKT